MDDNDAIKVSGILMEGCRVVAVRCLRAAREPPPVSAKLDRRNGTKGVQFLCSISTLIAPPYLSFPFVVIFSISGNFSEGVIDGQSSGQNGRERI